MQGPRACGWKCCVYARSERKLRTVLRLYLVALAVMLAPPLMPAAGAQAPSDPMRFGLPPAAVEIVPKRTRFAKHFDNGDGSFTAIVSAGRLHYQDTQGRLQDIHLGFHPSGAAQVSDQNAVTVTASASAIALADTLTGDGIRWVIPGGDATVNGNAVTYTADGLTWTETLSVNGSKSSATVTAPRGPYTYSRQYAGVGNPGATSVAANGDVVFASGITVPRMVMIGADGQTYPCSA